MKQGDVGTELIFTVKDQGGTVVDMANASRVVLVLMLKNQRVERNCTILEPRTDGRVMYTITADDLHQGGVLSQEVRVEFVDGRKFTSGIIRDAVGSKL